MHIGSVQLYSFLHTNWEPLCLTTTHLKRYSFIKGKVEASALQNKHPVPTHSHVYFSMCQLNKSITTLLLDVLNHPKSTKCGFADQKVLSFISFPFIFFTLALFFVWFTFALKHIYPKTSDHLFSL